MIDRRKSYPEYREKGQEWHQSLLRSFLREPVRRGCGTRALTPTDLQTVSGADKGTELILLCRGCHAQHMRDALAKLGGDGLESHYRHTFEEPGKQSDRVTRFFALNLLLHGVGGKLARRSRRR